MERLFGSSNAGAVTRPSAPGERDEHITIDPEAPFPELAGMLARFGSYAAYWSNETRKMEAQHLVAKGEYERALLLATAGREEKTEAAKKAAALSENPQLVEGAQYVAALEAEHIETKGRRELWQTAYEAVSRIVTVRTAEMELERRA